jgi:serine/threonine-protein kinase
VDRRTDVWAFGCVLFEALARKRAFGGDSMTEVLASVLEREPDWGALPPIVPENVRCLLRRCLTKDRHGRLRDIGDARLELEETISGSIVARGANAVRRRAYWPAVAAGLIVAAAGIGVWGWLEAHGAPAPEIVRSRISCRRVSG